MKRMFSENQSSVEARGIAINPTRGVVPWRTGRNIETSAEGGGEERRIPTRLLAYPPDKLHLPQLRDYTNEYLFEVCDEITNDYECKQY